jgi:hypothetical protein
LPNISIKLVKGNIRAESFSTGRTSFSHSGIEDRCGRGFVTLMTNGEFARGKASIYGTLMK